jgi:hypothetical protein
MLLSKELDDWVVLGQRWWPIDNHWLAPPVRQKHMCNARSAAAITVAVLACFSLPSAQNMGCILVQTLDVCV